MNYRSIPLLLLTMMLSLLWLPPMQGQTALNKPWFQNVPSLDVANPQARVLFVTDDPSTTTRRQVQSVTKANFLAWLGNAAHYHVSSDITDASLGGNGVADSGKLVKYGATGSITTADHLTVANAVKLYSDTFTGKILFYGQSGRTHVLTPPSITGGNREWKLPDATGELVTSDQVLPVSKAIKPASIGIASNVTPTADPHLIVAIVTSGTYRVRTDLITSANLRVQWTFPNQSHVSGVTVGSAVIGATATPITLNSSTSTSAITSASSGLSASFTLHASSSGDVQVRWAQNTTSVTSTTVYSGSSLVVEKIL